MSFHKDTKDHISWQSLDEGVFEEFVFTDPISGDNYTVRYCSVFPTTRSGAPIARR